MRPWFALAACAALLAGCSEHEGNNPADPRAYAVRIAVTPAPGAPLQRLEPPAEALAALRSPMRADLRLFDAEGTALPMAALAPSGGRAELRDVSLEAFPILGTTGALKADGAVLSIEDRDGGRVVRVTRTRAGADGTATLGTLFDTRGIDDPAHSLRLDAGFPVQQPVNFQVDTSRDLKDWTPLASKILYRAADRADALGPEAIPLDKADLRGRYVRVTWSSPSRLLAPVVVRGATLVTARPLEGARPRIATSPVRRVDAHDLRLSLPHGSDLAALRILPKAGEMIVPLRVFGRNAPDQDWAPLGAGTLRQDGATIELSGGVYAQYRIEADRRTPGFLAEPAVELVFTPAQLVALFNGKPPYSLAAGTVAAEDRYLAIDELMPGWRPGAEARLPVAKIAATPGAVVTLAAADSGFDRRKALLWGLLVAGVLALGLMVWRLWRPGASQA